jgi:ADP-ribose pyrophosphatase YjhB (NUDIX family)
MTRCNEEIEIIARGVCIKEGQLLLCHTKGARNTYLPGGHIECGESAKRSLSREIEEELGKNARVGRFLGVVEHTYRRGGKRLCEINVLFNVRIAGICPCENPSSCEDYIEFWWVPVGKISTSRLEPAVLRKLLGSWVDSDGVEQWASTHRDSITN